MEFTERRYSVLLVSSSPKFNESMLALLPESRFYPVTAVSDVSGARRRLLESKYDIVIINAPLPDDFGIMLALDMSETNMGILLMVKNDVFSQVAYKVEDNGVFTLSKPLSAHYFYSALKLVSAYNKKLRKIEEKTKSLKEKMADIRVVNRAKWLLMEKLNLSEKDAHYYIEKQAMDLRIPRREVAGNIIRTYET